jgi:hypothetical protein
MATASREQLQSIIYLMIHKSTAFFHTKKQLSQQALPLRFIDFPYLILLYLRSQRFKGVLFSKWQ